MVFEHPSARVPTVFGSRSDPRYSLKAIQGRVQGFMSGGEPTRMATGWQAAGARGIFAKAGAVASGTAGIIRGTGKFAFGPAVWGMAAGGKSRGILGAMARRAVGPGIILGAFALLGGAKNLLGGGYSMESPAVAWGHTPGMTAPYTDTTMTFTTANRTTQNMGATGSLAFALHNQRKA